MDTFERIDENEPKLNRLFEMSRGWLQGKKLTTFNLMEFVTTLIPMVQKIVDEPGKGHYKKRLIMSVLDLLIDKLTFGTDEEEAQLKIIIHETVPGTIDLMINISQGKLNLNKDLKKVGMKLFSMCMRRGKNKKSYTLEEDYDLSPKVVTV
jgi:hypothetical protein